MVEALSHRRFASVEVVEGGGGGGLVDVAMVPAMVPPKSALSRFAASTAAAPASTMKRSISHGDDFTSPHNAIHFNL